jgi:hypothetical protein
MSEVKRLTLRDEKYGLVNTALLPPEGGCNLLCLTDRQVAIIRGFVFPAVRWPTRWVTPFHGDLFDTDQTTFEAVADEIDDLDLEVNGGHNVPCQSLADALGNLIAIANSAGSLGGVLANIPDADWFAPEAEQPPEEGVPPDAFETWAAYRTWKCQAAWAVWNELDRVMIMLEGFSGLEVVISLAVPTIWALTSISFVTVPPAGLILLATSVLAMVAIWGSNALIMDQMRTWWSDHQDAIVCQLYNSGDAATALAAIGENIEDAIQAIEWGALLPLAGPLGDALATAIGVFQNNSLVNPLFKLITGVVLIEVECPCAEVSPLLWHFDTGLEGWYWTLDSNYGNATWEHGWAATPTPNENDPADSSPGCLSDHVHGGDGSSDGRWSIAFAPGELIAEAGMRFYVDWRASSAQSLGIVVRIVYQDNAEDGNYVDNPVNWGAHYITVTTGNVGKSITRLDVSHHRGSGGGEMYMAVDNAYVVRA